MGIDGPGLAAGTIILGLVGKFEDALEGFGVV